jgi:hypothetical protein
MLVGRRPEVTPTWSKHPLFKYSYRTIQGWDSELAWAGFLHCRSEKKPSYEPGGS